jgi:hypothetical protein
MKCLEGCTCRRHSKPKHPEGCTCGIHSLPKCPEGCTCAKHTAIQKCPEDCTCGKHNFVERKCKPGCTCKRHSNGGEKHPENCTCKVHITVSHKPCEEGCTCGLHHGNKFNPYSYGVVHKKTPKKRGLAKLYKCEFCDKQAAEWAYIHGTPGINPEDYMPLCKRCHLYYDDVPRRVFKAFNSPEARIKAWETRRLRYGVNGRRDTIRK